MMFITTISYYVFVLFVPLNIYSSQFNFRGTNNLSCSQNLRICYDIKVCLSKLFLYKTPDFVSQIYFIRF